MISAPDSSIIRDTHAYPMLQNHPYPLMLFIGFLMDLTKRERPKGYNGDVTPILPTIPSISHKAPDILSKPKLLDNIHPSRLKNYSAEHPSEPKHPKIIQVLNNTSFRISLQNCICIVKKVIYSCEDHVQIFTILHFISITYKLNLTYILYT